MTDPLFQLFLDDKPVGTARHATSEYVNATFVRCIEVSPRRLVGVRLHDVVLDDVDTLRRDPAQDDAWGPHTLRVVGARLDLTLYTCWLQPLALTTCGGVTTLDLVYAHGKTEPPMDHTFTTDSHVALYVGPDVDHLQHCGSARKLETHVVRDTVQQGLSYTPVPRTRCTWTLTGVLWALADTAETLVLRAASGPTAAVLEGVRVPRLPPDALKYERVRYLEALTGTFEKASLT